MSDIEQPLRILASRAARLRISVALLFLAAGLVLGVFGALAVDHAYFQRNGIRAVGYVTVLFDCSTGMVPPLALSFIAGRFAGKALLRARRPAWIDELSRAHDIPRDELAALAEVF